MDTDLDATHAADAHVKPYVVDDGEALSLNFSMLELQSRMRRKDPDALDLAYTRTMMGFVLFDAAPASLVMIGLGGGSLAKFCHRHLPGTRLVAVEINPHVIALRDRFGVPPDDERWQVVQADGADYVARQQGSVDVLLVDGFDYDGQPPTLCSSAFYDTAVNALSPHGVMVVNLHAGHAEHAEFVGRIERSFGGLVLEVKLKDEANSVVFAFRDAAAPASASSALRRPAAMAPTAWSQIKPALGGVAAALQRWRQAESP